MPPAYLVMGEPGAYSVSPIRARGCTGKATYRTWRDAQHIVRRSERIVSAYHCDHCRAWHVTTMKARHRG